MLEPFDIYLIRHGEASLPWSQGLDAPLSDRGHRQARELVEELRRLDSCDVISSPLLRAQQTAQPLAQAWGTTPTIENNFCEVPLAADQALRKAWVQSAASMHWHDVEANVISWRLAAWTTLLQLRQRSVIFTHFMLINALVTFVTGNSKLVEFEPDYVSVTQLRLKPEGGAILIAAGNG